MLKKLGVVEKEQGIATSASLIALNLFSIHNVHKLIEEERGKKKQKPQREGGLRIELFRFILTELTTPQAIQEVPRGRKRAQPLQHRFIMALRSSRQKCKRRRKRERGTGD